MNVIHQRALLSWSLLFTLQMILLLKSRFGIPQRASPNHTGILTHHIQIKEQVYLVTHFHFKKCECEAHSFFHVDYR